MPDSQDGKAIRRDAVDQPEGRARNAEHAPPAIRDRLAELREPGQQAGSFAEAMCDALRRGGIILGDEGDGVPQVAERALGQNQAHQLRE